MKVPDDTFVFLDGEAVAVDRRAHTAHVNVAATADKPSVILAFGKAQTTLLGPWADLPWQIPPLQRNWYVGVRLRKLYSGEERRPEDRYYYDNRVLSGSPVLPPVGETH